MAEIDPIRERREREDWKEKNKPPRRLCGFLYGCGRCYLPWDLPTFGSRRISLVKGLNAEKDDLTLSR